MRFNSYEFIFVFLPAVWLGWRALLGAGKHRAGVAWLCLGSLVFYGYWNWLYLPLLTGSLVINFLIGGRLSRQGPSWNRRFLLGLGLAWNIGLLGYFKYSNFLLENVEALTGAHWTLDKVILPLGISFFTFQKIAFLVDAWRGQVRDVHFLDFTLFVLFFPQLIAGPIVHHGEFIPQLKEASTWKFDVRRTLLGICLFSAGLFQKSVVADTLAPLADSTFGLITIGTRLRLFEAWTGVGAYSLQLFFDFAGYSHMALGLALFFGFRLPVNFMAPYRAGSVIEFWRRWHITLSSFLRDYVYIPLGGSRRGFGRHLGNLMVTMTLAGLWHGAGWTFVLWGAFHGVALVLNHLWRRMRGTAATRGPASLGAHLLTLATIAFGWVLFRASDLASARLLFESLLGLHGVSVPVAWAPWVEALAPVVRPRGLYPNLHAAPTVLLVLGTAAVLAVAGPFLLKWFGTTASDITSPGTVRPEELSPAASGPGYTRLAVAGMAFALGVAALSRSSPFLYFQF